MSMKKVLVSMLIAAATIGAAATPLTSVAAVDIQLNFGPPPPRHEFVPAPRRGWVWTPGFWQWRGNQHVWRKGVWVRERPGHAYHPHRWVERDGRWHFERGRWDRRRDSDGDGVPDRFDARPNNPHRR